MSGGSRPPQGTGNEGEGDPLRRRGLPLPFTSPPGPCMGSSPFLLRGKSLHNLLPPFWCGMDNTYLFGQQPLLNGLRSIVAQLGQSLPPLWKGRWHGAAVTVGLSPVLPVPLRRPIPQRLHWTKKETDNLCCLSLWCRHRHIFPGRRQPSIVCTDELNYRVRNGNGWALIVIGTDSITSKPLGSELTELVYHIPWELSRKIS